MVWKLHLCWLLYSLLSGSDNRGAHLLVFIVFLPSEKSLSRVTWLIFMDEWQCHFLIFSGILVLIFFLLESWHSASLLHYCNIMSLFIIKKKASLKQKGSNSLKINTTGNNYSPIFTSCLKAIKP